MIKYRQKKDKMGKRARIFKADLPNENKAQALKTIQEQLGLYMQLLEKKRRCTMGTQDFRVLTSKVNSLRFALQTSVKTLREIDFELGREVERGFELYSDNANSYYAKRLTSSVNKMIGQEEVKKINHLIHTIHNDQDRLNLQRYVDAKPQQELNSLVMIAVQKYQERRSDFARAHLNTFLGYFHKKLAVGPHTRATHEEIRATRADFNGYFNIPSVTEIEQNQPYSKTFLQASLQKNKTVCNPFSYNLENNKAWKTWQKTTMLGALEMPLRQALGNQGISSKYVGSFNCADFERILFNEYAKEKYNPKYGNTLSLSDINENLESRHKKFFWKYNAIPTPEEQQQFVQGLLRHGVEQAYIDVLMKSILEEGNPNPKVDRTKFKGKIPYFSTHHKNPIYAIGALANRQANYVGIAEFKDVQDTSKDTPEHDIWHLGDGVIRKSFGTMANGDQAYDMVLRDSEQEGDLMEYLVDTRFDTQNDGKSWTVSLGYKEEDNIRAEITEFSPQKTKVKNNAKRVSSQSNVAIGWAR